MTLEEERIATYQSIARLHGGLDRLISRARRNPLFSEEVMTMLDAEFRKMDRLEQDTRAMIIRCHGDRYSDHYLAAIYRENY